MYTLDPATLVRDANVAKRLLKKTDKTIVALKDCSFIVPKRFFNANLGNIGDDITVLNCVAFYDLNKTYTVINSNNIITVTPTEIRDIVIEGTDYTELFFEKDSIVMPTTVVVRRESVIYDMLEEFIMMGNVPWYLTYEDMARLFDTAASHAGSKAANNFIVFHIMISIITRLKSDRSIYFRQAKSKRADFAYIPFSSIWYSYNNTTSKLVGAYTKSGITASLVEPSNTITRVERLVRK